MTASPVQGGSSPGGPFEPEGVVWTPVSPRLATSRRVSLLIFVGVLAAVSAAAALAFEGWMWAGVIVLLVIGVWGWVLVGRQVAALGYAEREDDLLVRRGVMFRELVVVPYGRMQYVDVQAGPIDRAFGIAQVQLHTASPGTDASIPGLTPQEAARLRDRLASRGQAQLAGL